MTDFERYIVEEHVEDFNDRVISRRELMRRVTLITGSTAATVALLSTLGCSTEPTGTQPTPTARDTSQNLDFATPPAQPTTDGITVKPDDPGTRSSGWR